MYRVTTLQGDKTTMFGDELIDVLKHLGSFNPVVDYVECEDQ